MGPSFMQMCQLGVAGERSPMSFPGALMSPDTPVGTIHSHPPLQNEATVKSNGPPRYPSLTLFASVRS